MDFLSRFEMIIEYAGSAYKLAKDISTSQSVISSIRKGKTKPSFDLLERIVRIYEVIDMNWLISGKGEMQKKSVSTEQKGGNEGQESVKIQLNYCQDMVKSKDKIISLLEETLELKDEKLQLLSSDNEKLKILLKNCQEKKDYAQRQE